MIPLFEKKEVKTPRLTVSYLEAGDPAKDLQVLVHGNTSSNLFYLSTMKALENDLHVIAPDLRGYGYTEKLPSTRQVGCVSGPRTCEPSSIPLGWRDHISSDGPWAEASSCSMPSTILRMSAASY